VVISAKVLAFIGNGKLSFIQILLSTPLCHVTTVVSKVPAGSVTVALPPGAIGEPPIAAILPQYGAVSDCPGFATKDESHFSEFEYPLLYSFISGGIFEVPSAVMSRSLRFNVPLITLPSSTMNVGATQYFPVLLYSLK
jgi:hypothetical protein